MSTLLSLQAPFLPSLMACQDQLLVEQACICHQPCQKVMKPALRELSLKVSPDL